MSQSSASRTAGTAVARGRPVIAHVLQPWTTLLIKTPSTVRQTEDSWLMLEGIRDLAAWVHVSQVDPAANLTIILETSPTPEESFFIYQSPVISFNVTAPGVYFALSRATAANPPSTTPLQQYLRWAVVPTGGVDCGVTFRLIVGLPPAVPDFAVTCGDQRFTNPALGGF